MYVIDSGFVKQTQFCPVDIEYQICNLHDFERITQVKTLWANRVNRHPVGVDVYFCIFTKD